MDQDSRSLEQEMLTFFRLYPRLHRPNASTSIPVERAEYPLLRLLETTGPVQLGHAARALDLDASTLTRHAQSLARKNLVHGIAADDRRVTLLDLTVTGRQALREVTADRMRVLAILMEDWTLHDQQAFCTLLKSFNTGAPPDAPSL